MADGIGHRDDTVANMLSEESPATPEEIIRKRRDRLRQKRTIVAFLAKLISAALAIWLIFTFLFGIGLVEGEAMYPRLRDGDLYLYFRVEDEFHIGDVVTFAASDGVRYVGRIVARGGDTVDMSDTGELLVNGYVQDEEIFYPTYKTDASTRFPCTLQDTQVFLLCDLRTEGEDSRAYGALETSGLDGKVITILRRRGI